MANIKSSKKRAKIAEERRLHNKMYQSAMKNKIKTFEKELDNGNLDGAETKLKEAKRYIDKVASKGIIHKRTAARKKSKLQKLFNSTNINSAS